MMKWENRNRISMGYLHRAMHRSKHQNQLIIYVRFDIQTYIVCAFNATCFQCANCQHVYSLTFSLVFSLKVGSKNVNRHYTIKNFSIVLITHSLMVHVSLLTSITKYVNYLRINVWKFNSNSVLWNPYSCHSKTFFFIYHFDRSKFFSEKQFSGAWFINVHCTSFNYKKTRNYESNRDTMFNFEVCSTYRLNSMFNVTE